MAVPDVGAAIAESIIQYAGEEQNKEFLTKLNKAGLQMIATPERTSDALPLAGKTFVLTGTLSKLTRSAAEEALRQLGGKPASSVSRQTDYVIVGAEPGSKYQKALDLGIAILEEEEFLQLLQETEGSGKVDEDS